MREVELIFKDHNKWKKMVKNFGCDNDTAEDIVQDMYLKIYQLVSGGLDIMFNEDEVNTYYVFKTLRTIWLDVKRKESKVQFIDIEYISNDFILNEDNKVEETYKKVYELLMKLHWFDRKVYQEVEGGESIRGLSKKSGISYDILYNSYRKVKKYLKDNLDL